ncbi:MAG: hypothetical protein ACREUB_10695 [Burkholderiales bacterium]
MPLLAAIVVIIQLCFAYHALKTGRPYWWLFVIMAFPVMGCVLYYFIEIFPTSRESRRAAKAMRALSRALDPERTFNERLADLEACGSVDNRMALARTCIEHRKYYEATVLYRSCMTGMYENDPDIRFGLAGALELSSVHEEALKIASKLRETHPAFRPNDVRLVLAKALEGVGRLDDALAEFKFLADAYPGEEGRWRYGAILKRTGRSAEANDVFQAMLRRAERMPAHYRDAQGEWLKLARENLQG